MKFPEFDRDQFLRELFESEDVHCGPTAEEVSRLVRHDRERRHQRLAGIGAAAVIGLILALQLWTPRVVPMAEVPQQFPIVSIAEPEIRQASFAVEKVDDAGLLEMLKDEPVALASLPNGERRLMMIVRAPSAR